MFYKAASFFTAKDGKSPLAQNNLPLILLVLGVLAALRNIKLVSHWHMTHWAFTYEHGFIKRGLIGEITSRVFGTVTPTIINSLSWGIMLLLAAALIYLFIKPALESKRVGAWLFAIVAVTHSGTIPHFEIDIGRFDHINLLILIVCLFVIRQPSSVLRFAVIPLLCLTGLLVHEAFFFMFLPLIFAIWFYEERCKIWPKLLILFGLITIAWAIAKYGILSNITADDYIRQLKNRHIFHIAKDSVDVLFRGLKGNLAFNLKDFFSYLRPNITHHIVFALTLLPSLILFKKLICGISFHASACENRWLALLVAAALAPITLYVVATDHFRWWSIAITNLFIVFSYLAVRGQDATRLADVIERSLVIVACVIGTSLVFGPLGIMIDSYPRIDLWFLPHWKFSW